MAEKQAEVKQLGDDAAEKQEMVDKCRQGALQQRAPRMGMPVCSIFSMRHLLTPSSCRAVILE